MRLLIINTEKSWRGGERQTLYAALGFMQQGTQVALLARTGSPLSLKAQAAGIAVFEVRGMLQTSLWLLANAASYDLIHVQTAKAQTPAVITLPLHRVPVVYTRRVNFRPKGWLTKIKYRYTSRVVAISTSVKTVLEQFGVPGVTVIPDVVVPRKLDRDYAYSLLTGHGISEADHRGKKIIATIAAVDNDKDPFTMLEAVRELAAGRSDFIFLHFGDGPLMAAMQQKIAGYNLKNVYFMMGFVSDVEDMFSLMDIFCMSSRDEGLCSSVLDAFVYKVPVVATSAGGLTELVSGRGLLCAIQDSTCLAARLADLLQAPEIVTDMVNSAYEYVMLKHSLKQTTDQYLELFKPLLNPKA